MKILITGGFGFVGSYAIEKYLAEGWDVTVLDNMSTNAVDSSFSEKLDRVLNWNCLEYKWGFSEHDKKYDLILHLASPVGPAGVLKWAGDMAKEIMNDVYWAIEGALHNKCPLIFMSTSEVYGHRSTPELLKETDDKILKGDFSVRNEYSMGKLLAEIVLSNTAKVKPLNYHIIRPFNISGARQQPNGGFVLPRFAIQVLKNEPITVFGDGTQVRSFTHAKDIVDGIYSISTSDKQNEIWNIGTPFNKISIGELASKISTVVGHKIPNVKLVDPKTIYGDLYSEAWDKVPNPQKIQDELKWVAEYSIDEIINDVVDYWRMKV